MNIHAADGAKTIKLMAVPIQTGPATANHRRPLWSEMMPKIGWSIDDMPRYNKIMAPAAGVEKVPASTKYGAMEVAKFPYMSLVK